LAVETRADAPAELLAALAGLDDPDTRLAVTVERAILEGLDAGCQAPMAAHAVVDGSSVRVRTVVYAADGGRRIGLDVTEDLNGEYIRRNGSGNGADAADGADPMHAARELGFAVARRLLDQGAAGLVSREQSS
jgi:hydroxymethylbilane synthase